MSSSEYRPVSRRGFLKLGAMALGAAGVRPLLAAEAPPPRRRIPIALQLYSVRGECGRDLPGTLASVGKMGYAGVEFAGYCNRNAQDLRRLLDDNGLRCCGTHTAINTLLGDQLQRTVEFNKTLGNPFLIVPSLGGRYVGSRQAWLDTAHLFNEIDDRLRPQQMRCGYHNHAAEFRALEGGAESAWDVFFGNTHAEVVMQLDTGNCQSGGGDPVAILRRYPGRATTVHLKAFGGQRPLIGEDRTNWPAIFELCETTAATAWYIVEFDSAGGPPLDFARQSLENLRRLGK